MRYQVTAQVECDDAHWTWSRQVPTFTVEALNEQNARDIATDIVSCAATPGVALIYHICAVAI